MTLTLLFFFYLFYVYFIFIFYGGKGFCDWDMILTILSFNL